MNKKPSELFEGENSSLRKTFEESVVIEHCSEPSCPECNLAAFNAGKQAAYREVGEIAEGIKKEHREFECNGAHNGQGCFETWCDMKTCTSKEALEFKNYNQALDDLLQAIKD